MRSTPFLPILLLGASVLHALPVAAAGPEAVECVGEIVLRLQAHVARSSCAVDPAVPPLQPPCVPTLLYAGCTPMGLRVPFAQPWVQNPYPTDAWTVGYRECWYGDHYAVECEDKVLASTPPLQWYSVTPYARAGPDGSQTFGATLCGAEGAGGAQTGAWTYACSDVDLAHVGPAPPPCDAAPAACQPPPGPCDAAPVACDPPAPCDVAGPACAFDPCATAPFLCDDLLPEDALCPTYNPGAETNACLHLAWSGVPAPFPTVGTREETVDVPTVTPTVAHQTVCPLGPYCVVAPVPGAQTGSQPTPAPAPVVGVGETLVPVALPVGFVEATRLCAAGAPCRVTV